MLATPRCFAPILILLCLCAAGCGSSAASKTSSGGGPRSHARPTTTSTTGTTTTSSHAKARALPSYVDSFLPYAKLAGCTVTAPPEQGYSHLGEGSHMSLKHPPYSSNPPTSGPHFGITAKWGYYTQQIQDEFVVHNMEHGGVIVWYGGAQSDRTPAYTDLVKQHPKMVIEPRKSLPTGAVDITSWGILVRCPANTIAQMTNAQLTKFIGAYVDAAGSKERDGEADIPPIVTGTRDQLGAYTDGGYNFATLPTPPNPQVNSTLSMAEAQQMAQS